MLNISKTTKIVAFAFMLAFLIPSTVSAFKNDSWGDSYSDYGWSDWSSPSTGSYDYGSYSYDYTPDYSYDYSTPSYSTPNYSSYGGGYDYGSYYTGSTGGGSYYPSYTGSTGGSYYTPSTPSTSYSSASSNPYTTSNSVATNNTTVTSTNTNANQNNSSASATGGNAVNNNVNNVYVYTNPTGNAVVNNPAYQRLDGYCIITPSNPRIGQTVTATAYMTGGIGDYTYTWGGDLTSAGTGVSTSFTSYNPGTKNITVTARSGQDVKTVNCNVTFQNDTYVNNSLSVVCYPSVQSVGINQVVTWNATVTGGSGYYTYSWTGSDSLYGNNSSVSKSYTYAGQKYATVTVTSNGQSVSGTCYTNVNNIAGITTGTSVSGVYVQPAYIKSGTAVSGVYLNDLPATGIDLTWMHYMIALMVIVLAAVATYVSKNKTRFSGVVDSE